MKKRTSWIRTPSTARGRFSTAIVACGGLLLIVIAASPGVGSESSTVGWLDAWRARLGFVASFQSQVDRKEIDRNADGRIDPEEAESFAHQARYIGFTLRLPRSLLAAQVGITLALCGAAMQVLFRNPLAEPYTLGLASGGALGALIAICAGWSTSMLGVSSIAAASFAGSILVVAVGWWSVRSSPQTSVHELILGGVAAGLFCGAMMMLVTSLSSERVTFEAIRWMMGSLDPLQRIPGLLMVALSVPAWVYLPLSARSLNQYRAGSEVATSRGVHVARLQGISVLTIALATSAVVSQCGPIGFVGLIVPHIASRVFGSDCRVVLPASALLGGVMLVVSDWASQTAMGIAGFVMGRRLSSATLPIGVVTALVGVPIFVWLMRRRTNVVR